ncbi:amidase family protein [Spiroplasma endosymbiont of Aspidapion aeneum]|uniref:amidase family protein n=1 Tax=Spiroplasma endosymbiont of Aspidapion aeneum TaxID=3066276 RepID=UPI00313AF551
MILKNLTLKQINKKIVDSDVTVEQLVNESIKVSKKHKDSNFCITMMEKEAMDKARLLSKNSNQAKDNFLFGVPYYLKDCICVKDSLTTCGSKMLENYYPPYNAKVYNTLEEKQTILLGKVAMDELAMGGTGLTCFTGHVFNPLDNRRIIGGSSSGSAYAVSAGIVSFSIGTDTGDSIRRPAALCGVYGFKPTYGSISRYGCLGYTSSLDTIGYFTNSIEDCAILSESLYDFDENDMTSINNRKKYTKLIDEKKHFKIGYLDYWLNKIDNNQKKEYLKLFEDIKSQGHTISKVLIDNDILENLLSLYRIITFSEATSTQANLDGIKFGYRAKGDSYEEIVKKTRQEALSTTVKRRYVLGEYMLHKENQKDYLVKAQKIRRKLINQINDLYKKVDILIIPANTDVPPLINNLINNIDTGSSNKIDDLLLLANFTGMPSLTIPFIRKNGLPICLNINAKYKKDENVFQFGKIIDNIIKQKYSEVDYE